MRFLKAHLYPHEQSVYEGTSYSHTCADINEYYQCHYPHCCCTLQEPGNRWSQSSNETDLQRIETDKVLCQFSQICVKSIVDKPNVNLKDVIAAMKAMGYQHVANLLTRCFNGTQVH